MNRRAVATLAVVAVAGVASVAVLRPPKQRRHVAVRIQRVVETDAVTSSTVAAAPTRDGARAAALEAATASQRWLYMDDAHIAAAVRAMATPRAADRLVHDTVDQVAVARRSLATSAGRVWWIVRPLAWRIDSLEADQARVSVWTVTVLSAADVAVPQADWLTVSVELLWVGDGWLVDAVNDQPGPTPGLGPRDKPWEAEPLDEALAGFTRVADAR